jgi:hypothetical protein
MLLGRTSWWWECVMGQVIYFIHSGWETERLGENRDQGPSKAPHPYSPSDPLQARPHLPKFPLPPKIVPPGRLSIQHMSLWGTFHIQTLTVSDLTHVESKKVELTKAESWMVVAVAWGGISQRAQTFSYKVSKMWSSVYCAKGNCVVVAVLINLIVVNNTLSSVYISNHHIVHLEYLQFLLIIS